MSAVWEVTLQKKGTDEFWLVDVLAPGYRGESLAAVRASAKMRREHGVTDCTWRVWRIRKVAEAPNKVRPSRSWIESQ